jgi:rare lipoprotein A
MLTACAAPTPPAPAAPSPAPAASLPPPAPTPVFTEQGLASWYGAFHQGQTTASGEAYDMHELTAAHRSLPFGTVVRVTNLESGKTVKVRINDRGPHVKNRIIDLSSHAARELGIRDDGVARVKIEQFPSDQMVAGK